MWSRDASSGTTAPYAACRSTWLCSASAASRGSPVSAPTDERDSGLVAGGLDSEERSWMSQSRVRAGSRHGTS